MTEAQSEHKRTLLRDATRIAMAKGWRNCDREREAIRSLSDELERHERCTGWTGPYQIYTD